MLRALSRFFFVDQKNVKERLADCFVQEGQNNPRAAE